MSEPTDATLEGVLPTSSVEAGTVRPDPPQDPSPTDAAETAGAADMSSSTKSEKPPMTKRKSKKSLTSVSDEDPFVTRRAVAFAKGFRITAEDPILKKPTVEAMYRDITSLQVQTMSPTAVCSFLGVDVKKGLTQVEAEARKKFGSHSFPFPCNLQALQFVDDKLKESFPEWVEHIDAPSGFACLREGMFHVLDYTELVVGDLM